MAKETDPLKALRAKEKVLSQTLDQVRDAIFGPDRSRWIARSADEVAAFFGVNRRTVMDWIARGMPHGKGYYPLDRIQKWKIAYDKNRKSDEDPMLGGDSPALEQYRAARARLAELDLAEREGEILRADVMRDTLTRWSALIRDAGEILQRQFGIEASNVLSEALEDAEREVIAAIDDGLRVDTRRGKTLDSGIEGCEAATAAVSA